MQVKEHASKAQPRVKQAKILRDPERIDPADGLPRSRGLGFVEFSEHEHAICALRHLNNNPAPFSEDFCPPAQPCCNSHSVLAVSRWTAKNMHVPCLLLLVTGCNHASRGCCDLMRGHMAAQHFATGHMHCSIVWWGPFLALRKPHEEVLQ